MKLEVVYMQFALWSSKDHLKVLILLSLVAHLIVLV